jgi:hypothetical protein
MAESPDLPPSSPFLKAFNEGAQTTPQTPAAEPQAAATTPTPAAQTPPPVAQQPQKNEPQEEPQDPDMPPETKSEEGKKGWKTWKENFKKLEVERDTLRKEREDLEKSLRSQIEGITKELEVAKKGYIPPDEIEALKKEREELRLKLRVRDVQEDPSWQEQIAKPLKEHMDSALQAVPREQRALLERLLSQPPSDARMDALDDLAQSLSPIRQTKLGAAVAEIDKVNKRREALMSDQKALADRYEAFQKESAQAQSTRIKQEHQSAIDSLLKIASDPQKGLGVFIPGADEQGKQSAYEAASKARAYATSDLSPQDRANLAAWAVQGEHSVALLRAAHDEISKLRSQLEKVTAAKPSGGASVSGTPDAKPAGFMEAFLKGAGG